MHCNLSFIDLKLSGFKLKLLEVSDIDLLFEKLFKSIEAECSRYIGLSKNFIGNYRNCKTRLICSIYILEYWMLNRRYRNLKMSQFVKQVSQWVQKNMNLFRMKMLTADSVK